MQKIQGMGILLTIVNMKLIDDDLLMNGVLFLYQLYSSIIITNHESQENSIRFFHKDHKLICIHLNLFFCCQDYNAVKFI